MEEYSSTMCRICFQEYKDDFESIFIDDMSKNELSQLGLLYEELFNLSILANEHHPQYLCNYCILQLKLFHKFKTKALEAQEKFSEFADEEKEVFSILELSGDEIDMKFELKLNDNKDKPLPLVYEDTKNISALEIDDNLIQDVREDEEFEEVQYLEEAENESESLSEMDQDLNMDPDKIWQQLKNFACKDCDKVFEKRSHLTRHRKDVHKVIKYTCTMCPKKFLSNELLQVHINIHNGLPGFQCNLCDKTFKQKAHYIYHIQGHRNERNSQCHLCDKCFLNKSDLRIHLRVHSDERRYECDVCGTYSWAFPSLNSIDTSNYSGRKFRAHTHMTNHRYTHFGKTLECELCRQKYTTPATLKTHIKSVHRGECPYACLVCNKRFKRRHHLKVPCFRYIHLLGKLISIGFTLQAHHKIHLPKTPSQTIAS